MATMVHDRNEIWIIGGSPRQDHAILRYNIEQNEWSAPTTSGADFPPLRAHSAVVYQRQIFVFGGSSPTVQASNDRGLSLPLAHHAFILFFFFFLFSCS